MTVTTVKLRAGERTAFTLRAVPRPEFSLPKQVSRLLDTPVTPFTLRGDCKNVPDDTPCTLTWLIDDDDAEPREVVSAHRPRLRLRPGGEEFLLDVSLDAWELGLFGAGKIGCKVQPDFPHCPAATLAPGPITYDNHPQLYTKWVGGERAIGAEVNLSVEARNCFRGHDVFLEVYENDLGEAHYAASGVQGMSKGFVWVRGEATPSTWRIGCTSPSGSASFDYMDTSEDDGPDAKLELDFRLWIAKPGASQVVTVSQTPGESTWRQIPSPRYAKDGEAKASAPTEHRPHMEPIDAWVRFRTMTGVAGYWAPGSEDLERWDFSKGIPVHPLKKENIGELRHWVYCFKHDLETNHISLMHELYCAFNLDGWVYPVANIDPATRATGSRERSSKDEVKYLHLKYDPDKEDVYFCASRFQLPHERLLDYETGGRGDAGADAALRRLRDRCVRYEPWDESFQQRYLDLGGGKHNIRDARDKQALGANDHILSLIDPMHLLELAQSNYLREVKALANLAGGDSFKPDSSKQAQKRFLASLAKPVIDQFRKHPKKLAESFYLDAYDDFVREHDAQLAVAQKLIEYWQQYKQNWFDDAQLAADDTRFIGKGLYREVVDDHLLLAPRFAALRGPEPTHPEWKWHEKNEDDFFRHWAQIAVATSSSKVGQQWLYQKYWDTEGFVHQLLHDTGTRVGTGRKVVGTLIENVDIIEQHAIVPMAKFSSFKIYGPTVDPAGFRETFTSSLDEISGGVKVLKEAPELANALGKTREVLRARLDGIVTMRVDRVHIIELGEARTLAIDVDLGADAPTKQLWANLDAPMSDWQAQQFMRTVAPDVTGDIEVLRHRPQGPAFEGGTGLRNMAGEAEEAVPRLHGKLAEGLGRAMVLLNTVNVVLAIPQTLSTLGDSSKDAVDKFRAVLSLAEAGADFVASLEIIKRVAWHVETFELSLAMKGVGTIAAVLGVALSVWNAVDAFRAGQYQVGVGHTALAMGTAAVFVASTGFVAAGAATWWAGVGVVLMILGFFMVFFAPPPEKTPIERWLDGSPWGKHPSTTELMYQMSSLLNILVQPKLKVLYATNVTPPRLVLEIYSLYYVPEQTQFQIRYITLDKDGKRERLSVPDDLWLPAVTTARPTADVTTEHDPVAVYTAEDVEYPEKTDDGETLRSYRVTSEWNTHELVLDDGNFKYRVTITARYFRPPFPTSTDYTFGEL